MTAKTEASPRAANAPRRESSGLSAGERRARGQALRDAAPRAPHAGWKPPQDRRDPVEIVSESNVGRSQKLVPIRFGRTSTSPFAFHRGAAAPMAADDDALFLQVKEARASVLEPYAGKSLHANHGRRVVVGQRIMQTTSDVFLGWTRTQTGRDTKIFAVIDDGDPRLLRHYGRMCAHALARARDPRRQDRGFRRRPGRYSKHGRGAGTARVVAIEFR